MVCWGPIQFNNTSMCCFKLQHRKSTNVHKGPARWQAGAIREIRGHTGKRRPSEGSRRQELQGTGHGQQQGRTHRILCAMVRTLSEACSRLGRAW